MGQLSSVVIVGLVLFSLVFQGCGGQEKDPRVAACQEAMAVANTCGHIEFGSHLWSLCREDRLRDCLAGRSFR